MAPRRRADSRRAFSRQVEIVAPPARPVAEFGRWVADSVVPGSRVLNIGGGCNTSGRHPGIRERAGCLVAVDPSGRIHADSDADERHQLTLEQYAATLQDQFDVAFAVFVLEHVARPGDFVTAAAATLRPGGSLFALTPNQRHYFGLAAWAASRLGIEEGLLNLVRDRDTVAGYHVPTEYRLNSVRAISRHLQHAGFAQVEFRMWDLPRMYEPYLPGPFRPVANAWSALAYRTGRPSLMGHLTFKATR